MTNFTVQDSWRSSSRKVTSRTSQCIGNLLGPCNTPGTCFLLRRLHSPCEASSRLSTGAIVEDCFLAAATLKLPKGSFTFLVWVCDVFSVRILRYSRVLG